MPAFAAMAKTGFELGIASDLKGRCHWVRRIQPGIFRLCLQRRSQCRSQGAGSEPGNNVFGSHGEPGVTVFYGAGHPDSNPAGDPGNPYAFTNGFGSASGVNLFLLLPRVGERKQQLAPQFNRFILKPA